MRLKACVSGASLLALTAALAGCNPYPLPGPLVYGKCGADAHTEAYPLAKRRARRLRLQVRTRKAFWRPAAQGDQPRN